MAEIFLNQNVLDMDFLVLRNDMPNKPGGGIVHAENISFQDHDNFIYKKNIINQRTNV